MGEPLVVTTIGAPGKATTFTDYSSGPSRVIHCAADLAEQTVSWLSLFSDVRSMIPTFLIISVEPHLRDPNSSPRSGRFQDLPS